MFKVQYQREWQNNWTTVGSYPSETSAIQMAKSVSNRPGVDSVRVVDEDGRAVWFA